LAKSAPYNTPANGVNVYLQDWVDENLGTTDLPAMQTLVSGSIMTYSSGFCGLRASLAGASNNASLQASNTATMGQRKGLGDYDMIILNNLYCIVLRTNNGFAPSVVDTTTSSEQATQPQFTQLVGGSVSNIPANLDQQVWQLKKRIGRFFGDESTPMVLIQGVAGNTPKLMAPDTVNLTSLGVLAGDIITYFKANYTGNLIIDFPDGSSETRDVDFDDWTLNFIRLFVVVSYTNKGLGKVATDVAIQINQVGVSDYALSLHAAGLHSGDTITIILNSAASSGGGGGGGGESAVASGVSQGGASGASGAGQGGGGGGGGGKGGGGGGGSSSGGF